MNNKYLISIVEASQRYGIGRDKLYALVRSNPDIPTLKIGGITKINSCLFEQWIDSKTKEGIPL